MGQVYFYFITVIIIPITAVPVFVSNIYTAVPSETFSISPSNVTTPFLVIAISIAIDPVEERNFVLKTMIIIATIELLTIGIIIVTAAPVFTTSALAS